MPRVAVAVSGGRDSTALLHCTLRAAAPLGVEVLALHVHHGLVAQAEDWLAQVQGQARRWGAAFLATRLQGRPAPGDSVEAWARRERYAALAEMARQADCRLVLLAHHRRDQAETFLLQALRGAGAAGLAAMPALAARDGLHWARPWLHVPREAIEAYVKRHRLGFMDDASNADLRFARNRLRQAVWPALARAFPDAESCLGEAARQAAQGAQLAAEIATLDLRALELGGELDVGAWTALSPARRRNALQAWLTSKLEGGVPGSLVLRLCDELPGRQRGRWPAPGAEVALFRGRLICRRPGPAVTHAAAGPSAAALDLGRPGRVPLPAWGGYFEIRRVARGGVPSALLAQLQPRPRSGGERFRLAAQGLARSLKKQFQAAGVPAWEREGPLLYLADGRLLYVPGLGVDAGLLQDDGAGQALLQIRWCPAQPGTRQTAV